MSYPGKIEDYQAIRELEGPLRHRSLDIVRTNLGQSSLNSFLYQGITEISGAVDMEDDSTRRQVNAAEDTILKIVKTEGHL